MTDFQNFLIEDLDFLSYEVVGLNTGMTLADPKNVKFQEYYQDLLDQDLIQPGDFVFYNNADWLVDKYNHVAIVTKVTDTEIMVIDMDGAVDGEHAIDASPSEDIHEVMIVTVNE